MASRCDRAAARRRLTVRSRGRAMTVRHNQHSQDGGGQDISAPDPVRWPGLATPPRSPLRARVAEQLFRRAVDRIPVSVLLPGGERLGSGGADGPTMRIVRPRAFFHRLGADANIGFGEAYLVGDWT